MVWDAEHFFKSFTAKGAAGDRGTYNKGYHGLGDPDDKTLSEIEIKVLIPCWEKDIILRDYCANEDQEYKECRNSTYFINRFYTCYEQKRKLNSCVEHWKNKLDLREQATADYLEERTMFRRTGLTKLERENETATKEGKAKAVIDKIRPYILKEEEMKKYEENLKARTKGN